MGAILGSKIDPTKTPTLTKIHHVFDLAICWSQDGSKTVPRAFLGGSWVVLGGVLGRSWGLLGPLGTILSPSWDHQTTRSKTRPSTLNRCKLFGSILAPKMGPKTTPRRPQNESKIKTKNASLFYRSWIRLGPALRRSWAHLGSIFGHFALVLPMSRENQRFRKKTASRRMFGPT